MTEIIITESMERNSRFRLAHENAKIWYWMDNLGNKGHLRAIGEMEALDRLSEVFPERGVLTWIHQTTYEKL